MTPKIRSGVEKKFCRNFSMGKIGRKKMVESVSVDLATISRDMAKKSSKNVAKTQILLQNRNF